MGENYLFIFHFKKKKRKTKTEEEKKCQWHEEYVFRKYSYASSFYSSKNKKKNKKKIPFSLRVTLRLSFLFLQPTFSERLVNHGSSIRFLRWQPPLAKVDLLWKLHHRPCLTVAYLDPLEFLCLKAVLVIMTCTRIKPKSRSSFTWPLATNSPIWIIFYQTHELEWLVSVIGHSPINA